MKNKNIRTIAVSLALIQALSLSACSLKKNNVETIELDTTNEIVEVQNTEEIKHDDEFVHINNICFQKHQEIYSNTFEDYIGNPYATTYGTEVIYDLDGNFMYEIPERSLITILQISQYSGYCKVMLEDGTIGAIHISNLKEVPQLSNYVYTDVVNNKDKIITTYTNIYDNRGFIIGYAFDNFECRAIASSSEYTLVQMGNNGQNSDNITGYIKNEFLISKECQYDSYAITNKDTYVYCEPELQRIAYDYSAPLGKMFKVLYVSDGFACISLEGGRTTAYMKAEDLDLIERKDPNDPWFDINSYHYVSKPAYLFNDQSFNNPGTLIDYLQKVYVIKSNGEWSYVRTDNGEYGYMEPYLLYRLPMDMFVESDKSDHETRLWINQELVFTSRAIFGAPNTPTTNVYDIFDDKVMETYLKAYNPDGSLKYNAYVERWLPYYNGEGLHDASWQVGWYGNPNAEELHGSHGCTNTEDVYPIFEAVEPGKTRILVHD